MWRAPTEGALVALTFEGEILGTAFVENGTATIPLDAPLGVPGDYLLTGTAYNTIPYQATVQVVPAEGPYVLNNGNTRSIDGRATMTATSTRAKASNSSWTWPTSASKPPWMCR